MWYRPTSSLHAAPDADRAVAQKERVAGRQGREMEACLRRLKATMRAAVAFIERQ